MSKPSKSLWRLALVGLLALLLQACSEAPQEGKPTARTREGLILWSAPKPVPEVKFTDAQGDPLTLADLQGKVVLLNLWATWCGPCREEMPSLDKLQAQLGGADFEVVALSIDQAGPEVVRQFYDEVGVENLALYIDTSAQAAVTLDALGVPTTLLLDRQGRELGRKAGIAAWDSPEMVKFLREVIESSGDTGAQERKA
jgi:thiol-disulfide isomerase/thioredoxin